METLDTLVDWATEEESGRWTDETLTSVLELVSGMNTLKGRDKNMMTFVKKPNCYIWLCCIEYTSVSPTYAQSCLFLLLLKKLTTRLSELCPT